MNEAAKTLSTKDSIVNFDDKSIKKFWSRVNLQGPLPDQTLPYYTGLKNCQTWKSWRDENGYGRLRVKGVRYRAHRVRWILEHGSIPEGSRVLHKCDNPSCLEITHLFLGSDLDNNLDKIKKNRHNPPVGLRSGMHTCPHIRKFGADNPRYGRPEITQGEKNGRCKLKEADVLQIRELCDSNIATLKRLAGEYRVSVTLIRNIRDRRIWTHV